MRSHTHISFFKRLSIFMTYGCADRSYANTCFPHATVFQTTVRVTNFLLFSLSSINLTRPSHFPNFHRWQKVTFCLTSIPRSHPLFLPGAVPPPHANGTSTRAFVPFLPFPFVHVPRSCIHSWSYVFFHSHKVPSPANTSVFTPIRPFVATRSFLFLR